MKTYFNARKSLNFSANVCDFCDKRFETVTQLDSHVSWHLKAPADTIDDLEVIVDLGKASCKGKTEKGSVKNYLFWSA